MKRSKSSAEQIAYARLLTVTRATPADPAIYFCNVLIARFDERKYVIRS
jgi:hypothetical protein